MPAKCPACGSRSISYRDKFRRGLWDGPGPLVCGRCGQACDLGIRQSIASGCLLAAVGSVLFVLFVGVGGELAQDAVPQAAPWGVRAVARLAGAAGGIAALCALLYVWCAAVPLRPVPDLPPAPGRSPGPAAAEPPYAPSDLRKT